MKSTVCKLGDLFDISWGDTKTTKAAYVDDGYLAFSASGADGKLDHYDHEGPGIVLSAIGAYCGRSWYVEGQWSCIKNTIYIKAQDHNEANTRFLYYAIQDDRIWPRRGGAQPFISQTDARNVILSIPKITVQTRIANILSAYDDLIENNRRRIVLLDEGARQLYREWFVRLRFPGHEHTPIANGVPEGWEKTNALQAMNVLSGGTPKTTAPDYWDGDIPFYTPKDASDHCYVLETERSITELGLKNCNSRLYPADTVFISARGTVGKLNLAYQPMAMSQSCYALVGKGHVSQLFLYCALQESIEYLKQHAVGAVFDAIVVDTFKLIPFLVPDAKIVRLFEETVTPMFRQVGNLMQQNQKLRAGRDLLLPRLMSGEIAV